MTTLSTLPPAIRTYLDDFVGRVRRLALIGAVGRALAVFLAWMMLWCAADRLGQLPAGVRAVALVIGLIAALALLAKPLLALRRRPDLVAAAAEVERRSPVFAQRLVTVTSRLLGSADYRGSDEIVIRLVREVTEQVEGRRADPPVSRALLLGPWAACSVLVLLIIGLGQVPDLRFGELAMRFLDPAAGIPPVTTTRLAVRPGSRDVPQSQPLTIEVQAERLGDGPVTLYFSPAGQPASRVSLPPLGGGRFAFTLASVDRDLSYYVRGGDARSPQYLLRVLRKPAVAQFRFQYEYPPYTRLPPVTITNTDGRIEAPAGTKVRLAITATEPLRDALLSVGTEKLLMRATGDPRTREADITVRAGGRYGLDLISDREVPGSGPGTTSIRAVPDVPPQVRLLRGGGSLRLTPRDIVPLAYEALDDYGLQSIAVRAQVNANEPVEAPVRLWSDPRRQQDVFNFDLATLTLTIGDVVTLRLVATDTAGHAARSEPLHVLISPRSVDLDTYERIAEVQNASGLTQSLVTQLEEAAKSQEEAEGQKDHQSAAYFSVTSRGDRALSSAAQTAVLLRQSLLRVITRSQSTELQIAVMNWIDAAEVELASAEDAFRQSGATSGMGGAGRDRLHHAVDQGRQLHSQLDTVVQGEQASAILADRTNLQAAEARPAPPDDTGKQRRNQTLQRMREDIATQGRQIGLDPGSGDFANQIAAKAEAERTVIVGAASIDFVAAVRDWAREMQRDPQQRLGLEGRLSAAAQAQAIRPDADLIQARDLEFEARAVAGIASAARAGSRATDAKAFEQLVRDVEDLHHLYELERQPGAAVQKQALESARVAATQARRDLSRWAGDPEAFAAVSSTRGTTLASAVDRQREAEDLAMQASAAAATHDYQQASAMDQLMVKKLDSRGRREHPADATAAPGELEPASLARTPALLDHHHEVVRREMTAARQLDNLSQAQDQLSRQIDSAAANGAVANSQQGVAASIAQVQRERGSESGDSSTSRDKAERQVLSAQDQLASMAQALAEAQAAAAASREAAMRAGMARQDAQSAASDQQAAAERAAAQAEQNARDAADRLARAAAPVSPAAVADLADRLLPYAPETDAARDALIEQLLPALQSFQQALRGEDAAAVDRIARDARQAIEVCQRESAIAQDTLMKRDPLVAAKWFAQAAARSLELRPPDLARARQHQASVSSALSRAWDQSIRRAASERLAALPSMAAVLGLAVPSGKGPAAGQQAGKYPSAREWGRLRPQDAPELNSALHQSDPPGYEEALKIYFEALSKAQEEK